MFSVHTMNTCHAFTKLSLFLTILAFRYFYMRKGTGIAFKALSPSNIHKTSFIDYLHSPHKIEVVLKTWSTCNMNVSHPNSFLAWAPFHSYIVVGMFSFIHLSISRLLAPSFIHVLSVGGKVGHVFSGCPNQEI
jgi:hypothetical protein